MIRIYDQLGCARVARIAFHIPHPKQADPDDYKNMSLVTRIENNPMTRFQGLAITICMIINMLDGFDVLVVAFTAPSIAADWGLSGTAIGGLLSAGLVGMTIGSLVLGPMADRFGRRNVILTCLVIISVGMLLSAFTGSMSQLAATRVLTGLGIGGMLPSLNTLVAEYSSLKWRSFSISFMQAGYPLGATLGGMIAVAVIAQYGWRSVYASAGILSSLMILIAWRQLPESMDYLIMKRPKGALQKINILLQKFGQPLLESMPPQPANTQQEKFGYADLLATKKLLTTTLMLSAAFFVVMVSFYFVLSWTPKILVDAGMSTSEGISGGVIINVGGIIGCMLLGFISSRLDIGKLIAVYMFVTAVLMVLFSTVSVFNTSMLVLTVSLGFFVFGSIVGLYALAPQLYPARSRSAGLSIAIGIGRTGGALSPILAGYLFDYGWAKQDGYILFAAPLLLSMVLVVLLAARRIRSEHQKV
jgi:benzoate transport